MHAEIKNLNNNSSNKLINAHRFNFKQQTIIEKRRSHFINNKNYSLNSLFSCGT